MDVEKSQLEPTHAQTLEKFLAMGKGDGEESYAKNSGLQKSLNKIPQLALHDALQRVTLPSEGSGTLVVADLGCSSGPTTIDNQTLIIDILRHRLPKKDTEFLAYFNDLPSNDFNNLFQLLSNDSRTKNFYAAGVPGSFFHRLFAQSSVHVFFSSLCLHWLSKIPDAVLDEAAPAYNRGNPWYVHSRSAVAKAYQQQASLDLKKFLQARAAELVSGGLLFFCCLGRSTSEPNEPRNCSIFDFQVNLNEVWSGLVAEGLLTEQQRDTFNIPFYMRNTEDIREAISSCGSLFDVVTAKLDTFDLSFADMFATSDVTVLSRKIMGTYRALFVYVLAVHVGKKATEVIWQRFEKLIQKRIEMNAQDPKFVGQLCIVGLIRK